MKIRTAIRLGLVVLILAGLSGCQARKKMVAGTPVLTEEDKLIRAVYDQSVPAKYLEFRLTGKAQMDEQKVPFIGIVKIVRDSAIWVSLRSSIGIELCRILARPDSVWVLSRLMKIKEKGDWKLMQEFTGYALDFNSIQGVMTQSLFTASGTEFKDLQAGLMMSRRNEEQWISWKPESEENRTTYQYLAQFRIDPDLKTVQECLIKDSNGQWAARVLYYYSKENLIKRIEVNSLDESHQYNAEVNVISVEVKDKMYISFETF